jgi:cytochrome b
MAAPAWDGLVRLTHWGVAALVGFNLLNEEGQWLHRWSGYTVVALVLMRLLWGVMGSRAHGPARLRSWWPTPQSVAAHVRELLSGPPPSSRPAHVGHNPLGACMVLALWATLLSLGATGWMMGLDAFWGEEWLEEIHEALAQALMCLVPLHVLGAVLESKRSGQHLVRAMIKGD